MSILRNNLVYSSSCMLLAMEMLSGSSALAAQVQVTVDGRAGPWDPVTNFVHYPYGVFINGQFDAPGQSRLRSFEHTAA